MTDVARKEEIAQARAVASQIRQGIHNYLSTLGLIARASKERHWQVLGYSDWLAYIDGEFGAERLRLPAEHRQKAVTELRLAGMSQRAIGSLLGVDEKTVRNDLAGAENSAPAEIVGRDGKTYQTPARRDTEPVSETSGTSAVATPVEPDQLGEVAPAAGGREDGAASSFEPPAGPDAAAVQTPDRPGLEEFVNDDPRVQTADYLVAFTSALSRAGGFMQFDAGRIAELASPSTWDAIEAHASVVAHWYETARKSRTGLRVIKGGVA